MKKTCWAALTAFLFPASLSLAGDLSAYEGRYPFEPVSGYAFFDNPVVAEAVDAAGGEGTIDWINGFDVAPPIERQEDALIASACEPRNCSGNSAAMAISLGGELIALCLFSQTGERGTIPGKLHWVGPGLGADVAAGPGYTGCPRDGSEFLEAYAAALR